MEGMYLLDELLKQDLLPSDVLIANFASYKCGGSKNIV